VERDLLEVLTQVKWILLAQFILIFLAVLSFILMLAFRVRTSNSEALLLSRDNFLAELALLEMKGEYEELLAVSSEMLGAFPNDLMANWYVALGNYKIEQYPAALSALSKIKDINKIWSADAVDQMIADVKSEMKGPRANDA